MKSSSAVAQSALAQPLSPLRGDEIFKGVNADPFGLASVNVKRCIYYNKGASANVQPLGFIGEKV